MIYCSSGAFGDARTVPEVLEQARRGGVRGIELASGLRSGVPDLAAFLESISDDFEFLVHNYFPAPAEPFVLNLASALEEERQSAVEFCREAMRLCQVVGAPFYSVHAGYVQHLHPRDLGRPDRQQAGTQWADFDAALERFRKSIDQLLATAEELDLSLLIENNVHAVPMGGEDRVCSHLLLAEPDSMVAFFGECPNPRCGLLLDVAHWRVSATHLDFDPVEEMRRVAPFVRALHLSENDGEIDSNEICLVDSWFWEPLRMNGLLGKFPLVLESYRLPQDILRNQLRLIETQCMQ
ncbi:MAG: TIM barrel protein [Verrucomicrobiota bacterium]